MSNKHDMDWILPEPTVNGAYGHGWDTSKRYFLELFILVIILGAAAIPIAIANDPGGFRSAGSAFLKLFGFAYWFLLYAAVDFGVLYAFVRGARGETPEVNDIFKVTHNYVNVILANLVTTVIVGIGFVALVVPGIYFACRLVFVPYLVVEEKMDVVPALRASWDLSRGKAGTVFVMGLAAIPIATLGLLLCGVGILFSMVWIHAAFASLYVALKHEGAAVRKSDIPAPPVPADLAPEKDEGPETKEDFEIADEAEATHDPAASQTESVDNGEKTDKEDA